MYLPAVRYRPGRQMPPRRLAPPSIAVLVLVAAAAAAPARAESVHAARVHRAIVALHAAESARRGVGVRSGFEVTPALRELFIRYRDLPRRDRREAAKVLARPTDGAADPDQGGYSVSEAPNSPYCPAGGHFCIHWVASGADAPDLTDADGNGIPDWVETVAGVAENVYSVENGQLGWKPP